METPSSTRRITRSQAMAASANNTNLHLSRKVEKQQQDRSALIDITNDSPIVGVAMGNLKTPSSSAMSKKRMSFQGRTPGSGEALLRCQVKTLLQKVEEEAELSKIPLGNQNPPLFKLQFHGLAVNSPNNLLVAPTPANTPQVLGLSGNIFTTSPVEEKLLVPQRISEKKEDEDLITRSLLLDFSDKSCSSECSSVLTYQGTLCGETEKLCMDDDNESIWSIQVNASSTGDDDEEEDDECDDNSYVEEEKHDFGENDDDGLVDKLCEGMRKISVKEWPKFEGKHIRFVYNSDDEIQVEEEMSPKA